MSVQELTCMELVELVTEYLEGSLADQERIRFEEHVAGCDGCAAYVAQMRMTVATVGRLREDDVAPPAMQALMDAFRTWKAGR